MHDSVLVSLAILKTNWDENQRGFIHNFVPFVAECLRLAPQREIAIPDLQRDLEARFGLKIPQGAIQTVLHRATRDKLARREHGVLVRNDSAVAAYDLTAKRTLALREHAALLDRFSGFCREELSRDISDEEAERALMDQLRTRTLPILRCVVAGEELDLPKPESVPDTEYLVSSFVAHLYERDPDGFGYLDTVVKGATLAAVLYLPDLGRGEERFKDVMVFLDTPTLLRVLGWEGPSQEAAAGELIDLATQLGAQVCCFSHTFRETQGVLDACSAALRSPHRHRDSRGAVEEFCLTSGRGPSDLKLAVLKMERELADRNIRILDGPPYTEALTFDEQRCEEVLQSEVGYGRTKARVRDLQSLAAVFRFRKGRDQRHLESCRAIFVTPNIGVARASLKFFNEIMDEQTTPLCLPEAEFTTLAWLKQPLAAADLPTKHLLADCYAALSPGEDLWRKYLAEIERLAARKDLDEEAYKILRFSLDARRALMEITLGDAEAFTIGTIHEVLERYRTNVRADLEKEVERQRAETAAETSRRETAEAETSQVASDFEDYRHSQRGQVDRVALKLARGAGRVLFGLVGAVSLIVLIASLPSPFPSLLEGVPKWVTITLALGMLAVLALSVLNLWVGVSVRGLVRSFEIWLHAKLRSFLEKHFTPR